MERNLRGSSPNKNQGSSRVESEATNKVNHKPKNKNIRATERLLSKFFVFLHIATNKSSQCLGHLATSPPWRKTQCPISTSRGRCSKQTNGTLPAWHLGVKNNKPNNERRAEDPGSVNVEACRLKPAPNGSPDSVRKKKSRSGRRGLGDGGGRGWYLSAFVVVAKVLKAVAAGVVNTAAVNMQMRSAVLRLAAAR